MEAQDALLGPEASTEGQSVDRSPSTDNDQSEVADRQRPMHEGFGCCAKLMKLGLLIDTCQLPTEITATGITGVFGIASHAFYKIRDKEQLFDLSIRGFSGGALVLDVVAESKETADRFLMLLRSGDLLRMMNDELDSFVTSRCISCGRFDTVRLVRFEIERVDESEIGLIRQSAEELRRHYENQLLQIAQERQQTVSFPHTGQSEADSSDIVVVPPDRNQQPHTLKLKEAFSMEVVSMHVDDNQSGKACFVLKEHYDNPIVRKIGNLVHTYGQLVTGLESNDDSEISNVVQELKKLMEENVETYAREVLEFAKELGLHRRYPEAILMYQLSPACDEDKKEMNSFAYTTADCVNELKNLTANVLWQDDQLKTEKHVPLLKNHVIPVMHEMLSKIRGTGCEMQEAWCLHFIEYALYCTEQWESRKAAVEEGLALIEKVLRGCEREHLLYSHLLNNLADNCKQMSEFDEAMKYYELALAAHHEAKNYADDEKKQKWRKQIENNIKEVREKLSETQVKPEE